MKVTVTRYVVRNGKHEFIGLFNAVMWCYTRKLENAYFCTTPEEAKVRPGLQENDYISPVTVTVELEDE